MKLRLTLVLAAVLVAWNAPVRNQPLQSVTINYPTRSGAAWPTFIEGGYYQKMR